MNIIIINNLKEFYLNDFLNNPFVLLLLVTLFVDIFTGNYVALKQRQWNSSTGLNGTLKHLGILTLVFTMLPVISFVTQISYFTNTILIYIIVQYTTSILENFSALGFDLDDSFTKYFKYLGNEKDENQKQNDKKKRGEQGED